jgi:hypothetical protein
MGFLRVEFVVLVVYPSCAYWSFISTSIFSRDFGNTDMAVRPPSSRSICCHIDPLQSRFRLSYHLYIAWAAILPAYPSESRIPMCYNSKSSISSCSIFDHRGAWATYLHLMSSILFTTLARLYTFNWQLPYPNANLIQVAQSSYYGRHLGGCSMASEVQMLLFTTLKAGSASPKTD